MRNRCRFCPGAAAAGMWMTLAAGTALAAPPTPAPENTLLGVRLLSSNFREVLSKFGQPQEIQTGSPTATNQAGGGGPMMGGPMGGGGGAPPSGLMGRLPRMAGGGGGGGAEGKGGGGALPGFNGSPSGGAGSPFMPPPMQGGGGASGGGQSDNGETTWWYHFPKKELHYSFLFNREGRVIQIQEYGWNGGARTRQGIGLSSRLVDIIQRYGWSNDGEHFNEGGHEKVTMRYGGSHRVAFQLVDNKVVGVTLALVK